MTKQQIQKMEEAARRCRCNARFSGLDEEMYKSYGCPDCECNDECFKAGYKAAMSEVDGLIEALEKCKARLEFIAEDSCKGGKCGYESDQSINLAEKTLKTWRDGLQLRKML